MNGGEVWPQNGIYVDYFAGSTGSTSAFFQVQTVISPLNFSAPHSSTLKLKSMELGGLKNFGLSTGYSDILGPRTK